MVRGVVMGLCGAGVLRVVGVGAPRVGDHRVVAAVAVEERRALMRATEPMQA
jgi:hypothetical protein